jgi:hypothetical protein
VKLVKDNRHEWAKRIYRPSCNQLWLTRLILWERERVNLYLQASGSLSAVWAVACEDCQAHSTWVNKLILPSVSQPDVAYQTKLGNGKSPSVFV